MEALIRFLQNNALIILVMFIISVLSGIMSIILGWKRFCDDILLKMITLPVYAYLIIFFLIALAIIFRPAIKDRPKGLKTIKGESFGVQRIVIDGKRFVNCTFGKTELVYRGEAGVGFEGCSFMDPEFTFTFGGSAAATIKTLTSMYATLGFRSRIENTFKAIREGNLPIATPPSDAADN